jgi:hypothetical protein
MSSLMKDRDVFTRMRTILKEFFLKSRKEHLINEINNLLRNKFIDEINVSASLSFFQRVNVLLSTLIVKRQISLTLKKINIKLNNIERNTAKIFITLIFYAVATKTNAQREIDVTTTTIITSYNNINQQRQLKKVKREKTLIFKIKEQSEKNNLRMFFVKKLIKRLQWAEKIKKKCDDDKTFFQWKREIDNSFEENQESINYQ